MAAGELTDDDVFGGAPAAVTAAPTGAPKEMSDADVFGNGSSAQKDSPVWSGVKNAAQALGVTGPGENYLAEVGRRSGEAVSDIGHQETKPFEKDNTAGPEWLQRVGDFGGRVGAIGTDMISAAISPLSAHIQTSGTDRIAKDLVEKGIMSPEQAHQWSRDTADLITQASLAPSTKATPQIGANVGRFGEGIEGLANKFAEKYPNGGPFDEPGTFNEPAAPPLPKKVQSLADQNARNVQYIEGLNQNAGKMKDAYGGIYDNAREVSSGVDVHEPAMKKTVDGLLEDLKEDPAHSSTQGTSQAFRDLKAVADSFDESGNIPLDSVTLLKRRVNDLYSRDMSDTRGKIYNTLNQQLKTAISRAKKDNPEWGQLMDAGDNLFLNYKKTFVDDAAANKRWSLDDAQDYLRAKNSEDKFGAPAMIETRNKIGNIANIDNMADYEAMLRKLPPELHEQFTKDVIAANKENSPKLARAISSLYYASRGNYLTAGKNLFKMVADTNGRVVDPELAQAFPHVEDAISHHTGVADASYQKYLGDLYRIQNPDAPLALPAPTARPGKEIGDYLWNKQSAADAAAKQAQIDAMWNQNKPDPISAMVKDSLARSKDISNATNEPFDTGAVGKALIESLKKNGEFKQGGAVVNKSPTPAQKVAGNYKKHHVRFHGLDIAIENPKGSERSGVDRNGKEWRCAMPAHYGYIKRTIGADDSHIDVYLGNNERSNRVYVVDQKDAETGKFDEHKCFLGFSERDEVERAYRAAFSDKKDRIMKVTRLTISEFKNWLKNGNTKQPFKKIT